MNEQSQQTQQNAWAQTASQQQPLHPMVTGGGYMPSPPPTLPIQERSVQAYPKNKEITVSMGRLSLLSIAFSLMFLGALTFLGGFLLGIWFAGPSTSAASPNNTEARLLSFLHNQQNLSQNTAPSPQGEHAIQNLTGRVGEITHSTISNTTVPNVPSFLAPLVTATKNAAGQQLEYKIQQQMNSQAGQPSASSSQSRPSVQHQYQRSLPSSHYGNSSILPMEPITPPVITPHQGMPSPSTSHQESMPLTQGQLEDYTIQLGVFASKENAYSLVNDLQALNFITYITESKAQDGSHLYYVHSGRYKDYADALEAASQFAAQNIPGAIIVKVSQENKSVP
ncbi:MAG TPA: SPOR domain-containing protein [Alphaproteobacteria bacterium]|nr:SPOR domain-containing protein [Alphaproteobacteria bacterium]